MIPKRTFWFAAGTVSGFTGAVVGYGRLRRLKGRDVADRVAAGMSRTVERTAGGLRHAVGSTRRSISDAESELRVRYGLDDAEPTPPAPTGSSQAGRASRRGEGGSGARGGRSLRAAQ